jgi:hypothetical protein
VILCRGCGRRPPNRRHVGARLKTGWLRRNCICKGMPLTIKADETMDFGKIEVKEP